IGEDGPLFRENGIVDREFLKLPTVPSGENAGAAGRAFRVRGEGVLELHALAGDAVEVRRFHPLAAVGTGGVPAHVVEDDEEKVRPLLCDGVARKGKSESAEERAPPRE